MGWGVFWRAAAIAVAALSASAGPAAAQDLDQLFEEVLLRPDDPELNIAFAREAERQGALRHALAAYERVARAHPERAEAQTGYQRLRKLLSPARTAFVAQLGASFRSNVRTNPDPFPQPTDGTFEGALGVEDQRTISGFRLKSLADAQIRAHVNERDLTQANLFGWTGPVFTLAPATELHVAGGGGGVYLDDGLLYGEASSRITLSTLHDGLEQSLELYVAWREVFEDDDSAGDGVFVSLSAELSSANVLLTDDFVFLKPRLRYSEPVADRDDVSVFDEPNFATDFFDYGLRAAYFSPVIEDVARVGAGIGIYDRIFGQNVALGSSDRRDLRIEPTAHLVFPNVVGRSGDVRVDYRFQFNESNDEAEDFTNHVVGARLVWRF